MGYGQRGITVCMYVTAAVYILNSIESRDDVVAARAAPAAAAKLIENPSFHIGNDRF